LLQSPAPEVEARSQWPRASHSGLMHCTVQPGKYCTWILPSGLTTGLSGAWFGNFPEKLRGFCPSRLGVSREKIQFLVVELRSLFPGRLVAPREDPRHVYNSGALAHHLWLGGRLNEASRSYLGLCDMGRLSRTAHPEPGPVVLGQRRGTCFVAPGETADSSGR
jgi:hypothetical protein